MAWRIEYDPGAQRDLDKLDRQVARRIVRFMGERVAPLEDARAIGQALKGSKLGEFWKTAWETIASSQALRTMC